jgi:hypothetical protein
MATKTKELFAASAAGPTTTAGDKSEVIGARHMKNASLLVQWPAGTSAGVVKLRAAGSEDFAGTWADIQTNSFVVNTAVIGSPVAIQEEFLRVEVTTSIAGAAGRVRVFLRWEE